MLLSACHAIKRERVTLEQAHQALTVYQQISVRFIEVEFAHTLALASKLGIYAYDAYLIAAAQQLRIPLLALDRGLIHAAKNVGVSILEVNR